MQALPLFRASEHALLDTLGLSSRGGNGSLRFLAQGAKTLPWHITAQATRLAVEAASARGAFIARSMRGRAAALQDVVLSSLPPTAGLPSGDALLPPQAAHTRAAACGNLCPVAWSTRRHVVPVADASQQRQLGVVFRASVYRCESPAARDAFVAHPTRYTALLVNEHKQAPLPRRLAPAQAAAAARTLACAVCTAEARVCLPYSALQSGFAARPAHPDVVFEWNGAEGSGSVGAGGSSLFGCCGEAHAAVFAATPAYFAPLATRPARPALAVSRVPGVVYDADGLVVMRPAPKESLASAVAAAATVSFAPESSEGKEGKEDDAAAEEVILGAETTEPMQPAGMDAALLAQAESSGDYGGLLRQAVGHSVQVSGRAADNEAGDRSCPPPTPTPTSSAHPLDEYRGLSRLSMVSESSW
jgi:hypothetical protein